MTKKSHFGQISPGELSDLIACRPQNEILELLGINRATLSRWLAGENRIPLAASRLLSFSLRGNLHGYWEGWIFSLDGLLYPPGWGEGLSHADIVQIWFYKKQAALCRSQAELIEQLQTDLAFHRQQSYTTAKMGFMRGLVEIVQE